MRFAQVLQRWALMLGFLGFLSCPALADDEASSFIAGLGEQALGVLEQSSDPDVRKSGFEKLFTEDFDVPQIGRVVLGRFWRTATPEQQKEYLDLFQRYVIEVYSVRFSGYSGQGFAVLGQKPAEAGAELVSSQITSQDGTPPIRIDWRVSKGADGYKIVDVVVEGVSMLVTQRQEFSSVITQNGGKIDALIALLKKKVGEG